MKGSDFDFSDGEDRPKKYHSNRERTSSLQPNAIFYLGRPFLFIPTCAIAAAFPGPASVINSRDDDTVQCETWQANLDVG